MKTRHPYPRSSSLDPNTRPLPEERVWTTTTRKFWSVRIGSVLLVLALASHLAAIVHYWSRFHDEMGHYLELPLEEVLSSLWSDPKQDALRKKQAHLKELNNGYVFHIVFSTGCNAFQDWQSYAFFYHVMASGFTGDVTRIASCSTQEEANQLRKVHQEQIQGLMSSQFHLHTTPDFSYEARNQTQGKKYKFFNKPFGMRHWMTNSLGFPNHTSQEWDKTIIVLMDPDEFLIRPFEKINMTDERELWKDPNGYRVVGKGQPMGAMYCYGGNYINNALNVSQLLEMPELSNDDSTMSGLRDATPHSMASHYAVGPPYVVEATDMFQIVQMWATLVVPIHQQMYKNGTGNPFMAEMYAYSCAAAHLHLPHQLSRSFMISATNDHEGPAGCEAWYDWIEKTPEPLPPTTPQHRVPSDAPTDTVATTMGATEPKSNQTSSSICSLDYEWIPHCFHYCQSYRLGPYKFFKHNVPSGHAESKKNFLSCEHPLYKEPPHNIMDVYNYSDDFSKTSLSPSQRRRVAFSLCQTLPRMNAMATFYKDHNCPVSNGDKGDSNHTNERPANYSKVFRHAY